MGLEFTSPGNKDKDIANKAARRNEDLGDVGVVNDMMVYGV